MARHWGSRKVTGLSDAEETAVGLTNVVPLLVEDMLKESGGNCSGTADFQPHVVTNGARVTGHSPASSEPAAHALLVLLKANQRLQTAFPT